MEENCCNNNKNRPNRSDVHLSEEEEAKVEEETRKHFDDIAPKRHSKPQRSEYSPVYVDDLSNNNNNDNVIPELLEFQRLETDPQKLVYDGNVIVTEEEFVETGYYGDLNCIDKQHHTTGTGFIKIEDANNSTCLSLVPEPLAHYESSSCKGNPATNDWIPAPVASADMVSIKPNRSEN